MKLEEAINWYNRNKKKADKKLPGLSPNGESLCRRCSKIYEYGGSTAGLCSECLRTEREVRSGYRGAVRAQYATNSNLVSSAVYSSTAAYYPITRNDGFVYMQESERIYPEKSGVDDVAEMQARIDKLTDELNRIKSVTTDVGHDDILITGRKFRVRPDEEVCE